MLLCGFCFGMGYTSGRRSFGDAGTPLVANRFGNAVPLCDGSRQAKPSAAQGSCQPIVQADAPNLIDRNGA